MFNYKHLRIWLGLLLLVGFFYAAGAVSAQGLVGAPVDPRYSPPNDFFGLSNMGYDRARELQRAVTGASVVLAGLLGWYRSGRVTGQRLALEIFLLVLATVVIYIGGVFAINGSGGLGGCPVA